MQKRYNITVNGKSYTVDVEEIREAGAAAPAAAPKPAAQSVAAQKPQPAAVAPAKPTQAAPAAVSAGANAVTAPMPGTILSVKVKTGDAVKRGDILVILEAMKMENEILAHMDGVVAGVHVAVGASVNTGDPLISI